MDVVGSEIGQKMRSAIKAKLTELGCYVDDELPDYVMVMVANKRTRSQMEDDLQLFLGDNTELFVNWLHQVLKKLQEVTITTPLKSLETEKDNERSSSKEKSKEKKLKDKVKKNDLKKAKKKDKDKAHRKKEEKKIHKSKKKSKHHGMIRPNVPPLLMNMEKDSEPSITDVFAGQILKNHGFSLDPPEDEPVQVEIKPVVIEPKRPILPIIDPASIPSQSEELTGDTSDKSCLDANKVAQEPTSNKTSEKVAEKEEELLEIEAKIEGLKQKLAEQMESMSDDEDFLNIRTEAEELMNDFAEDVFQEIASQLPPEEAPPVTRKSPTPPPQPVEPQTQSQSQVKETPKEIPKEPVKETEVLPQIELNLPKRPVRERLGARDESKKSATKEKQKGIEKKTEKKIEKRAESPERYTPEREPDPKPISKSARPRLGDHHEPLRKSSAATEPSVDKAESSSKRLTSKVWRCAGVVRVRGQQRASSSLLMRAVADAHKSLLNIPPKIEPESKVKRALVRPMRRCVDAQNIVIQVPADQSYGNTDNINLDMENKADKNYKIPSDLNKEEYTPTPLSMKFTNSDYTLPRRNEHRTTTRRDDTLIIETINIHNPTVDKDKSTQFIVTMDGYHPNAFLAKKLETEGLLNDKDEKKTMDPKSKSSVIDKAKDDTLGKDIEKDKVTSQDKVPAKDNVLAKDKTIEKPEEMPRPHKELSCMKKRLSGSSEESDTQVIIQTEDVQEKRKIDPMPTITEGTHSPAAKKRKASPIVFNMNKAEKKMEKTIEKVRQRTDSASSDGHVIVTTATNTHKYDAVPPLSQAERKLLWCRAFPLCRYGSACAFQHPRCKFAASCTRRSCPYSHTLIPDQPAVASHVVPAANYKSITAVIPSMCKYYPNCVNPTCHYQHPKPCRYGAQCINKLECNFYHADRQLGSGTHYK